MLAAFDFSCDSGALRLQTHELELHVEDSVSVTAGLNFGLNFELGTLTRNLALAELAVSEASFRNFPECKRPDAQL